MGNCLSSKGFKSSSPPSTFTVGVPETAQSTHPTSTPLPIVSDPSSSIASPSRHSRRDSTHATTPYDAMYPTRRPLPSYLHTLLSNNNVRFRILVVGKPVSGKSSLIKTIFNVDMSGSPINMYGRTAEFCPRDNGHVVIHECSASGRKEFQVIQDFITEHNHKSSASERLHAIWICVPMSDVNDGNVDVGDVKMLLDTGVPLVVVFTKFDGISHDVLSRGNGDERARAKPFEEECRFLLRNVTVSANIVSTQPGYHDLIDDLVATTDKVILKNTFASSGAQAQQRVSLVPLMWSVSQRADSHINIQATISVGQSKYWNRLWSSNAFRGKTFTNCIEPIHADIVDIWNFLDTNKYLSSKAFKAEISYLVQDLSGSPISTLSRLNDTQGKGAAWLYSRYLDSETKNIRLVVGYIVDLTLILCNIFRFPGNVSRGEVESVINEFTRSSLKVKIHKEINEIEKPFEFGGNDIVMTKISDLILTKCGEPFNDA